MLVCLVWGDSLNPPTPPFLAHPRRGKAPGLLSDGGARGLRPTFWGLSYARRHCERSQVVRYGVRVYELLLLVHILSGIAWVGGGFLFMLSVKGIRDSEGHEAAERTMARVEKASRVTNWTPLLVLATGITMVARSNAWAFSQIWVYVSLALFFVALILGGGFADRLLKQMKQARQEGRHNSELLDRFVRVGFVEMMFLAGIVFLMVYKPL